MAEQKAKEVHVGGRRQQGPRPKVKNPGKILKRILAYVMKYYKLHAIISLVCI